MGIYCVPIFFPEGEPIWKKVEVFERWEKSDAKLIIFPQLANLEKVFLCHMIDAILTKDIIVLQRGSESLKIKQNHPTIEARKPAKVRRLPKLGLRVFASIQV